MAQEIRSAQDIIRLLRENPQFRDEVRRYVLSEELLSLPALVRELAANVAALAEAQRRTEERVTRLEDAVAALAEAQRRSEERLSALEERVTHLEDAVAALAEAQRRTEERVTRLEDAVAALAEAQRRSEERLSALEERMTRLEEAHLRLEERVTFLEERMLRVEERLEELSRAVVGLQQAVADLQRAVAALQKEVGTLSNVVGGSIETDLDDVLPYVMRQKGYRILGEPQPISLDGEVDVVLPVQSPDGRDLWVVAEAKVRLRRGDVFHLATQLADAQWRERMQRAGIVPPYLPYAYGMGVYPDAVTAAETTGIGVLSPRGEVLAPKEVS